MSGSDYVQYKGRPAQGELEREIVTKDNPLPVGLYGETDGGVVSPVPLTPEGHIEVAIHGPINPFGSVHAESITPEFQSDAVYGAHPDLVSTETGHLTGGVTSASVTDTDNLFTCSTGTTALSYSVVQSKQRVRYRPGQGVIGRFTALFSNPAANSYLVAGFGSAESGLYYGYNGTSFGILYSTNGMREVRTLTVSTGSSTAENVTVTLNGIAHSVAVTNSASTLQTAYEISKGTYPGWLAQSVGSTVVFINGSAGPKVSTFSLTASTAVGSFAQTKAGVATTDTWIPQASWNVDVMDGSGNTNNPSGVSLNPQNGNVFQIGVQYLGFGGLTFYVETGGGGNNPIFSLVHVIEFTNNNTSVSLSQPSFPFTMSAYSAGSTTDLSVSCASFAAFVEGKRLLNGPRHALIRDTNGFVGSSANTYYPLITFKSSLMFKNRPNQITINLIGLSGAHDDATPVTYYLIRNPIITAGTPNFQYHNSDHSTLLVDYSATQCQISSTETIEFALQLGQNSSGDHLFLEERFTLQPGDVYTIAARAVTGTATYVSTAVNFREDI